MMVTAIVPRTAMKTNALAPLLRLPIVWASTLMAADPQWFLARISHKSEAIDAGMGAEMLFLQRPEGTSENSQGQRPWKTPA